MGSAWMLVLFLLGLSNAQLYPAPDYSYLDVTFSSPDTSNCGQGNTGDAITLSVKKPTSDFTCFNINETFSNPDVTYTSAPYTCAYGTACGVNYTLTGAENFDIATNYSQIWYRQFFSPNQASNATDDDTNEHRVGRMRFQTYNGLDCRQVAGDNGDLEAWYSWNCYEYDGACGTVPYDVRSFAFVLLSEDDQGDKGCTLTAEYSAGTRPSVRGSLVALIVAVVFAAFWQ